EVYRQRGSEAAVAKRVVALAITGPQTREVVPLLRGVQAEGEEGVEATRVQGTPAERQELPHACACDVARQPRRESRKHVEVVPRCHRRIRWCPVREHPLRQTHRLSREALQLLPVEAERVPAVRVLAHHPEVCSRVENLAALGPSRRRQGYGLVSRE